MKKRNGLKSFLLIVATFALTLGGVHIFNKATSDDRVVFVKKYEFKVDDLLKYGSITKESDRSEEISYIDSVNDLHFYFSNPLKDDSNVELPSFSKSRCINSVPYNSCIRLAIFDDSLLTLGIIGVDEDNQKVSYISNLGITLGINDDTKDYYYITLDSSYGEYKFKEITSFVFYGRNVEANTKVEEVSSK